MSQFQTNTEFKSKDSLNNTQVTPYKPDEIYLPFDMNYLRKVERRKKALRIAKRMGNVIIVATPMLTFYILVVGGAITFGWVVFVFVIEPVMDFVGKNWLLIILALALLLVIAFAIALYPDFRANQQAKAMPVDHFPSTQTHVTTTRHEGIVIHNIINIQNNNK